MRAAPTSIAILLSVLGWSRGARAGPDTAAASDVRVVPPAAAVPWPTETEPDEPDADAPRELVQPSRDAGERPAPAPPPAIVRTPPAEPSSPLRPRGEAERMRARPVGASRFTFSPIKGLSIASDDGRYAMNLNLVAQFLYTFADVHPIPAGQTSAATQSFEIRRARAVFQGNVFSEHVDYYAQLQFSPRDLGYKDGRISQSPVFLWWVAFDRLRDLTPVVGQQWVPYSRQRVAPITRLQFVDFSLASAEFGLERDIGVDLMSRDFLGLDRLRYHVGVFLGEGTNYARPTDFGMIYVGRLEYLPFGDFDDYIESDLHRRLEPKLSIAAAYAFSNKDARNKAINGAAPTDGGTTDTHNVTADVMFKWAGFSLLADVWLRTGKRSFGSAILTEPDGTTMPAAREAVRQGMGWTAQAGYLIPRVPVEIAARYSGVRKYGTTSLANVDEAGPALSYYFAEHSVKLQLDHAHGWGEAGLRSDRVRLQLTVGF